MRSKSVLASDGHNNKWDTITVKGRKMNAKAPKRDLLGHPFSQFRTFLVTLGCISGALRAKGVISENLVEKGVSTELFLELIFH